MRHNTKEHINTISRVIISLMKSGKYRGGKHNSAADSEYCITVIHNLFVLHLRTSEIWRSQSVSVKSALLYPYLQDKIIKYYGYLKKQSTSKTQFLINTVSKTHP
jgi:hypothetical protein